MIRLIKSLLPVLALMALAPLHAQTPTESAKAEGKVFGRTQGARAQDASTREPDAATIPNFGGIPSQSAYFDDPDSLAPDSGAQSSAHEGYQAMRASANQRARFDPVDLDATIKRAQEVSADPLNYTSGMNVTGAQGRCVPLPSGSSSAGRYFATCNRGTTATLEQRSCPISLAVQITEAISYRYYTEVPFHTGIAPAISEFSGQLANGTCQSIGTADTCQVVREYGGQPSRRCANYRIDILQCSQEVSGLSGQDLPSTGKRWFASNIVRTAATSRNESPCAGLAGDTSCVQETEDCTDSDPVTRIVDGLSVTQPCWAWTRQYQCKSVTTAQDCSELEATPGCTLAREDCLTDEPCQTWERVFDCPLPPTPTASNQYICDGDVYCIDGSCETIEREANDEFKDAVVALNGMDQARREFDPDTLTLFKGERGTCSSKVFGVLNCCKGKGFPLIPGISLLVALGCNSQELLLHERDAQGLCAYVGSYCSDSVLGVCLTKKKAYCCFESKLSRILQEQGRQQLNKPWGKPKTESCAGFTIDEFARLDLSQMDFSEVYAEFTDAARLPDEMQATQDIQQKIEDYYATHGN